ncbi:heat shock protein 23-like [Lutzomyia longipalpis]|uniref:heat shock protein 23-like n=1 Tax=Lutzomyia longipalpis TaxID=7200 RepID=UPI0024839A1E|nr:heat shock protein 23-like [Lutzomyia longipalpis]
MSVLPLIVNFSDDIFDDVDPFWGFGITPRDLWLAQRQRLGQSKRRWNLDKDVCVRKNAEKEGFEMSLDVRHFKPEEISVKTVDNHIVVEGKHEEREDDNSFISRHFVRRYALPDNCNIQEAVSTMTADGILTVKAPPKAIENKERVIDIQQIAPPTSTEEDKKKK